MKVICVGALITLMATSALAFPPRRHTERGTIQSIDPKTRTLILQLCCETARFTLQDWTRIHIDGEKIAPQNILPGTPVRVSYRREAGVLSLYEVRSGKARSICTDCVACAR